MTKVKFVRRATNDEIDEVAIEDGQFLVSQEGAFIDYGEDRYSFAGDFGSLDTRLTTVENGWVSANETWTYVSVDDPTGVIKINSDVTTKYSLGMRIKMTNGGNTIFGILTKIGTYGGDEAGYTYLTFLHEIDPTDSLALHLMTNSAITNNYYSSMKVPYGFPINQDKWTITFLDLVDREILTPTIGTWYNLNNSFLPIHIGSWKVTYECFLVTTGTIGAPTITGYSTLSTANNSQSDLSMTYPTYTSTLNTGISGVLSANAKKEKILNITSKTNYYLNVRSTVTTDKIQTLGSYVATTIKAVCAYL